MSYIRDIETEDYISYKKVFEDNPGLVDSDCFIYKYDKKERLVSIQGETVVVYNLLSDGSYTTTDMYFNGMVGPNKVDYFEYSLLLDGMPKFVNNDTMCSDLIYSSEDNKFIKYSQVNTTNGSRLILQYPNNKKRGEIYRYMLSHKPQLICFQNTTQETEEQKYAGGGLVFEKVEDSDSYVRVFGMKNNGKTIKYPLFSKTYEYLLLKEMIDKGGFNEQLPEHFADIYLSDEISACFDLSFSIKSKGMLEHSSAGHVYKKS